MSIKNWKKSLILENDIVFNAIKKLEKTGFQIVLVVNKKNELLGTLTDGDIRSGILKGFSLKIPVLKLTNKKPVTVKENTPKDIIDNLMTKNSIFQIPVVKNKKVIGLHLKKEKNYQDNYINNYLFVMAGGKGKRLMPLTKNTPKPLLEYNKRPLIKNILIKARNEGFTNIAISINYLGNKIKRKLKEGKKFDLQIQYIEEKKVLGTAGALSFLKNKIIKPIIVTNCDIITDLKYNHLLNYHKKKKADITVVVKEYQTKSAFGEVEIKNQKIKNIIEKPISLTYINAGIYVLSPSIMKYLKKNEKIDMNEFIDKMIMKNKKITPYPMTEKWADVSEILKIQNKKNEKL